MRCFACTKGDDGGAGEPGGDGAAPQNAPVQADGAGAEPDEDGRRRERRVSRSEEKGRRRFRLAEAASHVLNAFGMSGWDTGLLKRWSREQVFDTPQHASIEDTNVVKHSIDTLSGGRRLNQYLVIKPLGVGSHGKVKLCLNTSDGRLYAVKATRAGAISSTATKTEIALLKMLKHPYIVRLYEVIDDPTSGQLYLALEYAPGGAVFSRSDTKPYDENTTRRYFRDIVRGLDYLHYNGVAHRDLKTENILRSADDTCKIADLGVAIFSKQDSHMNKSRNAVGTPVFTAPEVFDHQTRTYDPFAADIWSLGVCLYVMLFATVPFSGRNPDEVYRAALNQEVKFSQSVPVGPELRSLIDGMLTRKVSERLTLDQIIQHPWVNAKGLEPLRSVREDAPTKLRVEKQDVEGAISSDPTALLLAPLFVEESFKEGDVLMKKGDPADRMYFITSGEVDVLMDAVPGHSMDEGVLTVRRTGEFVGEIAVLQTATSPMGNPPAERCATLTAKTDLEVRVVSIASIRQAITASPLATQNLQRIVGMRREQNDEVANQLLLREQKNNSDNFSNLISDQLSMRDVERVTVQVGTGPAAANGTVSASGAPGDSTENRLSLKGIRVLYAEDSLPTQAIVRRILLTFGCKCSVVPDGRQAVDECESEEFDIILMDCNMPVLDGIEATRQLKSSSSSLNRKTPVIAVTADLGAFHRELCMTVGMIGYVQKPVRSADLRNELEKALLTLNEADLNDDGKAKPEQ